MCLDISVACHVVQNKLILMCVIIKELDCFIFRLVLIVN